jgi:hypothetical protein
MFIILHKACNICGYIYDLPICLQDFSWYRSNGSLVITMETKATFSFRTADMFYILQKVTLTEI